jgi:hypothetical protein
MLYTHTLKCQNKNQASMLYNINDPFNKHKNVHEAYDMN